MKKVFSKLDKNDMDPKIDVKGAGKNAVGSSCYKTQKLALRRGSRNAREKSLKRQRAANASFVYLCGPKRQDNAEGKHTHKFSGQNRGATPYYKRRNLARMWRENVNFTLCFSWNLHIGAVFFNSWAQNL